MMQEELLNKAQEAVQMVYGIKIEIKPELKEQLQNMYLLGVMEGVDTVVSRVMDIEDPEEALSYLEELQDALNNIRLDMMEREVKKHAIIPEMTNDQMLNQLAAGHRPANMTHSHLMQDGTNGVQK